jgi:hypothetical protein
MELSALERLRFKEEMGKPKKTQTKTKSAKSKKTTPMQHGSRFGPTKPGTTRRNTTRIRQYQSGSFFVIFLPGLHRNGKTSAMLHGSRFLMVLDRARLIDSSGFADCAGSA